GENPTTPLGASRLYNEAEIRVLLSDTPADLPGGVGDVNNIRLANPNVAGATYRYGVPTSVPAGLPALASGGSYNTYFAAGTTSYPDTASWTNALFPEASPLIGVDWPYAPLQPIAADVTFTNDPGAPLTTPAPGNAFGLTSPPPNLALTPCTGNPPVCPAAPVPFYNAPYPYYTPTPAASTNTWNLIDGYLRVEYRDAGGNYHPITAEWLALGFARGVNPPTAPGTNPINPNAILILQQPADRNGDGVIDFKGTGPTGCVKVGGVWNCIKAKPPEVTVDQATLLPWFGDSKAALQSVSMNNWYPINFYDARVGEVRDVNTGNASCAPNGVMNAVEIDVGNLKNWLNGTIPGSGNLVDFQFQNGYVLYFSDRRGMLWNPTGTPPVGPAGTKTGDAGLEDAINSGTQPGNPDGALEPIPAGKTQSPEDVNNNGVLDNWGAGNMGLGLGYVGALYTAATSVNSLIRNAPAGSPDPYLVSGRIANCVVGQKNWVSGARHVLKLVDGSLGNVPLRLDNGKGGFTVGSENPVYIQGDYNSSVADPTWTNPAAPEPVHAAAAVIADAVTLLSTYDPVSGQGWLDLNSLRSPSNDGGRQAFTSYYRVAISGGKNIDFPVNVCCGWSGTDDWGTDGGVHNFIRQLEQWGGDTLNYKGSLVSMYYSTYATGTDKNGGGTTYDPPTRNFIFDPLFTQPQNLPPGTPLFRDIDNLSYRQSFTPHTGAY
ncbi:MAG TPA: hypothetical protein VF742_00390, partial [Terracidiphilus sp.]